MLNIFGDLLAFVVKWLWLCPLFSFEIVEDLKDQITLEVSLK